MATSIPKFNSTRIFLMRIFKDNMYVPLLPAYVDDRQRRITCAVEGTQYMQRHMWEGM
jgi:hypothetical protein